MLLVEHTLTLALSSFLPSFSAHLPPFSLPFLPLPAALLLSPSFFSFVSLILSQYIAQAGPELAILLCQSVCRDGRCAPAHPSFAEVCCCHLDSRTFMILLWRFYSFVGYLLLFVLNLCYTHGLKFAPQKATVYHIIVSVSETRESIAWSPVPLSERWISWVVFFSQANLHIMA